MPNVVRKTISLPLDLARVAEQIAEAEGKTLSAVVQEALRRARAEYFEAELEALQDYWSRRARERGVLTEEDLDRYLQS